MNDLISRKDAIDAIKREIYLSSFDDPAKIGLKMAAKTLSDKRYVKSLPSAQRTGRWININEGKWNAVYVLKCSECGEIDTRMYYFDKFCPACGARMEVEDD